MIDDPCSMRQSPRRQSSDRKHIEDGPFLIVLIVESLFFDPMDLSILLPLSNHLELTRDCLGSLERTTRGVRWEVILIDDGTTDGTREFLRELHTSRHRAIFHDEGAPRGAAACLNAAAQVARAPLLCTLSPATVLLPGWIQPMLQAARRLPEAGCIGSVHREPISGLIDHTGVIFDVRGLPTDAGRSTVAPPVEPFTRWPAVSASCCVLSKKLHEKLGGFEEDMALELAGIDFCLRAAETLGARHYTANRSVIYLHRGNPEKLSSEGHARSEGSGRPPPLRGALGSPCPCVSTMGASPTSRRAAAPFADHRGPLGRPVPFA